MPRGHRLLIGREVAGEIFPGPHLALGLSALACFVFVAAVCGRPKWRACINGHNLLLVGPSCFGVLLAGHVFYFYTTLSVPACGG